MGKRFFQYFCIRILRLQKTLIFWSTNPLKIFKNCVGKCLWKHMLILHRIFKVLTSMLGRQERSFLLVPSHLFCYFFQYAPKKCPKPLKTLISRGFSESPEDRPKMEEVRESLCVLRTPLDVQRSFSTPLGSLGRRDKTENQRKKEGCEGRQ